MSCNTCAKSFSLLRKERGCPSCGFSFCAKCLDNKVFLPKLNSEAKVCAKCRKSTISSTNDSDKELLPPDAYFKRLAATEITPQSTSGPTGSNLTDNQILERLNKLRESSTSTQCSEDLIAQRLQNIKGETSKVSDSELQDRLAKLRGIPTFSETNKTVIPVKNLKTEEEEADDLLKQYLEQTQIDTKYKDDFDSIISGIESRVQKLKGDNISKTSKSTDKPNSDSEEEELSVKKIVEKIKAEASLDEYDFNHSTNDELPFCEICNEDAKMRCLGCKYLFCKRCFLEHKDDDDGCNKYEPYEKPK